MGGIPEFEIKIKPNKITTQNKLISGPTNVPNREEEEWLIVPAIKNIAIAAQP